QNLWGHTTWKNNEVHWIPAQLEKNQMPDLRGMWARDALYILENKGLKVIGVQGSGRIVNQLPAPHAPYPKNKRVLIKLEKEK
ncbi:MAG: PASTA domain-containing protein, partial [Cytophagales bacterium]|nr:PASTA domain-containing protein [Cytophagales bacterium]